ncbi:acetyl-CoA carboxylase carboxyltransferase subunit alpha [Clostridioides mangenotii]|nr:acetyl-CoA carboxylase carboxyltransferase subunit alpha [Clostridioides mangenotii]MCR1954249.1 acetyl-CoA carboxylase carboxyltransferase subunit alpha [Clostridioides mangenotii]
MTDNIKEKMITIENDIKQLETISKSSSIDLSDKINALKDKLNKLKYEAFTSLTPHDKVVLSRDKDRPTTQDYVDNICSNFIEFHGDRLYKDDPSIVGGIGKVGNYNVTIIGHQKGHDTKEKIRRNFGMPHPEGYRKALRLMKQAEKFNRPIITFVDTSGAFCGLEAEERGQGEAIARNLLEMSKLSVPVITFVIGEGGSGGALGIGVGNDICMLEHAVYSVISPEGLSSILFKDSSRAKEACDVMKLTSKDLYDLNIIDKIIKEPLGGAQKDVKAVSKEIKKYILDRLDYYKEIPKEQIASIRYNKFRNIGKCI